MSGSEDFSEQAMFKIFQKECQGMAREGTLTPERQFLAMMMYLPQSFIQKQVKNTMNKLSSNS